MAIESKLKLEKYQFGIDIQKTRQLYGMSGKILSFGQWISRAPDTVIIVEMNEIIAQHEAFFYQELNGHNHIIRTFGYIENNLNLTIFVQEYAQKSDLANFFFDNETNLSQTILIEIFSQISDAMSYVASKSIVHADLGCRNVLVYKITPDKPKNTLVKLTDFGLARRLDQPSFVTENSSMIPIRYCAPEILQDNNSGNYSERSDVYSMGVLMWEALSNGEMPYSSIAEDDAVKRRKLNDERLPRPSICDRELWILIEKCWNFKSTERINFNQIKEKLTEITVSELPDIHLQLLIDPSSIVYKYKLNTDVKMNSPLDGSYGKTCDARWLTPETRPIVLTKLDKPPTYSELSFYTKLQCPYIIHTFGFVENDIQSYLLLQERAAHGNLQLLLEKSQFQTSLKILIELFLQIINAMIYITEQNLVHGDLRCANVLVFQMNQPDPKDNLFKLTNFSSAHQNDPTIIENRRSNIPFRYCALEILRSAGQSNYSELSDVYSMGVLMWEVCSDGKVPYDSSILNSEVRQRKLNGEKLTKPWLCDDKIWLIIEDCWHNEPQIRYNFKDMKTRFSHINPNTENRFPYELNVDVKMGKQLNGTFGKKFYEATWIKPNDSTIVLLQMDEQSARQEVPFYLKFPSHAHIIHTFGLVKNNLRTTLLLQERALHGNLLTLLRTKKFQPLGSVLINIFLQIIDAMIYMTKQNIVYGDLCCENVLVFQMNPLKPKENLVKLTNFNLARDTNSSIMPIRIRYCAPEFLRNNDQSNYSEASDIYSMGVLMWEACSKGNSPFGSANDNDDQVRQNRLNNGKLSKPNECDTKLWDTIEQCLYTQPELRYMFDDIKSLISKICTTCSHCSNQYLTDDMITHQRSCPTKPIPPPDLFRPTPVIPPNPVIPTDPKPGPPGRALPHPVRIPVPPPAATPLVPPPPPRPPPPPTKTGPLSSIRSFFRNIFK